MPKKSTLGKYVRRIRTERNLSLRETARQLNISAGYLSRIETNTAQYPPSEQFIRNLASLLHTNFDALMQLANRVAADSITTILADPLMPELLRQIHAKNLSANDLIRLVATLPKKQKPARKPQYKPQNLK